MEYNKKQFQKANDKKVLHKIKKHWVVVSMALLMAIGGEAAATHVSAHADTTNNNNQSSNTNTIKERLNSNLTAASNNNQSAANQKQTKVAPNSNQASKAISNQASVLHQRILNNASQTSMANNQSKKNGSLDQRISKSFNAKNVNKGFKLNNVNSTTGRTMNPVVPQFGDYHGDSDASDAATEPRINFNYIYEPYNADTNAGHVGDDSSFNPNDGHMMQQSHVKGIAGNAFGSDSNSNKAYRMSQWANSVPAGYSVEWIQGYDANGQEIGHGGTDYSADNVPTQFPNNDQAETVDFYLTKNSSTQGNGTIFVYYLNSDGVEVNRQQDTKPAGSDFNPTQYFNNVPNGYVLSAPEGTDGEQVLYSVSDGGHENHFTWQNSDNDTQNMKFPNGTENYYIHVKSRNPKMATDTVTYIDRDNGKSDVITHRKMTADVNDPLHSWHHDNATGKSDIDTGLLNGYDNFVPSGFKYLSSDTSNEPSGNLTGGKNINIYVAPDKMSNIPSNVIPHTKKGYSNITVRYRDEDDGNKIISETRLTNTKNHGFSDTSYDGKDFIASVPSEHDGGTPTGVLPWGYKFENTDPTTLNNFPSVSDGNQNLDIYVKSRPSDNNKPVPEVSTAKVVYKDWNTGSDIKNPANGQSDIITLHGAEGTPIDYGSLIREIPAGTQFAGFGFADSEIKDNETNVIYVKNFNKPANPSHPSDTAIDLEYISVNPHNYGADVTQAKTASPNSTITVTPRNTGRGEYLSDTGNLGSDINTASDLPDHYNLASDAEPTYQFNDSKQEVFVPVVSSDVNNDSFNPDNSPLPNGNNPIYPGHTNPNDNTSPSNHHKWGDPLIVRPSDPDVINKYFHNGPADGNGDYHNPSDYYPTPNDPNNTPKNWTYNNNNHGPIHFDYSRKPENVPVEYIDKDNHNNVISGATISLSGEAGKKVTNEQMSHYNADIPQGYNFYSDMNSSNYVISSNQDINNANPLKIDVTENATINIEYMDMSDVHHKIVGSMQQSGEAGSHINYGQYDAVTPQGYLYDGDDVSNVPEHNSDFVNGDTDYIPVKSLNIPNNNPGTPSSDYDTISVVYVDANQTPGKDANGSDIVNPADTKGTSLSTAKKTDTFNKGLFDENEPGNDHIPYGYKLLASHDGESAQPSTGETYGDAISSHHSQLVIPVVADPSNQPAKHVSDSDAMKIQYTIVDPGQADDNTQPTQDKFGHSFTNPLLITGNTGTSVPESEYTSRVPAGYKFLTANWDQDSIAPNAVNTIYIAPAVNPSPAALKPINVRFIDQDGNNVTSDAATNDNTATDGTGNHTLAGYRYFSPKSKNYGQSINLASYINNKYDLDPGQPTDYYYSNDTQNVTVLVNGKSFAGNKGDGSTNGMTFTVWAQKVDQNGNDDGAAFQVGDNTNGYPGSDLKNKQVGYEKIINPNSFLSNPSLKNTVPYANNGTAYNARTNSDSSDDAGNLNYKLVITDPNHFDIIDGKGNYVSPTNLGISPKDLSFNGNKLVLKYQEGQQPMYIKYEDASDGNRVVDTEKVSGPNGYKTSLYNYASNVPNGYMYDPDAGTQTFQPTFGTDGTTSDGAVVVKVARKATGTITYVNSSDGNIVGVRNVKGWRGMTINYNDDDGTTGYDHLTPYNYQFDPNSQLSHGHNGYGTHYIHLHDGDNDIIYVKNMNLGRPMAAGLPRTASDATKLSNLDPNQGTNDVDNTTYRYIPIYYVNKNAFSNNPDDSGKDANLTSDILNNKSDLMGNSDYVMKKLVTVGNASNNFPASNFYSDVGSGPSKTINPNLPAGTTFDMVDPSTPVPGHYGDFDSQNQKGIIVEVNPSKPTTTNSPSDAVKADTPGFNPTVARPATATVNYVAIDGAHKGNVVGSQKYRGMTGDDVDYNDLEKMQPEGYSYAGMGQYDALLNDGDTDTIYVHDMTNTSNFASIDVKYVTSDGKAATGFDSENHKITSDTDLSKAISDVAVSDVGSDFNISRYENNMPTGLSDCQVTGVYGGSDAPTSFKENNNGNTQTVKLVVKPKDQGVSPYGTIQINYMNNGTKEGSDTITGLDTQPFDLAAYEYSAPAGWKFDKVEGTNYPDYYPNNNQTDTVNIDVKPDNSSNNDNTPADF